MAAAPPRPRRRGRGAAATVSAEDLLGATRRPRRYRLYSTGKGSPRREQLAAIQDGSSQCPYLVDPNTGSSLGESADIVEYLVATYG